ncbi:hypothetical protein EI555_020624, partial [Monodon monoceros]
GEEKRGIIYVSKITQLTQNITDVSQDQMLPGTEHYRCQKCRHKEAVFFQSHRARAEDAMNRHYLCRAPHFGHHWSE